MGEFVPNGGATVNGLAGMDPTITAGRDLSKF